jgi:DNA-binding response OmpR family regulator
MIMRLLVIDDEPDVIEVVRLTFNLRWPEGEAISAPTGSKGVELVRRDSPEIIILDIGLPGSDGFQVCEQIRRFSDVPIIMLSARHDEVDKVKGLELGADEGDHLKVRIQHLGRKPRDDPAGAPMIVNERGVGHRFVTCDRAPSRAGR